MSPADRSLPLPNWRRRLLHALGVAGGWLLFGFLWWLVFSQPWATRELTLLVAAALLLFPILTLGWVAHNRAIFRRLGPRRGVREVALRYEHDFNGRRVLADWSALAQARQVEIRIEGSDKRYVALAAPAPERKQPQRPAPERPQQQQRPAQAQHGRAEAETQPRTTPSS